MWLPRLASIDNSMCAVIMCERANGQSLLQWLGSKLLSLSIYIYIYNIYIHIFN